MSSFAKLSGLSILLFFILFISGCRKKEVFSSLTFSGTVEYGGWGPLVGKPTGNASVVLYRHRSSLMSRNNVTKTVKEIGRETTSSDGTFSMKLKWLDSRDTYYVEIFENNTKKVISSNNSNFNSYKALEGNFKFIINQ